MTEPDSAPEREQLVSVYVTNGIRTTAGPGPGAKQLPPAEASALVRTKLAIYGDRPPDNGLSTGGLRR